MNGTRNDTGTCPRLIEARLPVREIRARAPKRGQSLSFTSRAKGYPFEVVLPASSPVTGAVLADQIKSLDWRARRVRFELKAPPRVVSEVFEKLAVLLDPNKS